MELDLSCRGVWAGNGEDAMNEAKALAEASETLPFFIVYQEVFDVIPTTEYDVWRIRIMEILI